MNSNTQLSITFKMRSSIAFTLAALGAVVAADTLPANLKRLYEEHKVRYYPKET